MSDAIDNDNDGCLDCTFIDSAGITLVIPDNILPEGIAMSKFVYYNNINGSPVGNPSGFGDFYNYLRGIWLDNQPITYGGNGRNVNNPVCNFMYPGTTDPNFATNWTEGVVGNPPGDRRFLQSAGSFTLMPGAVHFVTTGVVWARATSGGPLASVALLQQHDDEVQQLFSNCFRVGPVGLDDPVNEFMFSVFPNPSNGIVNFQPKDPSGKYEIRIFNSAGKLVMQNTISSNENLKWETKHISKGIYWYQIISEGQSTKSDKIVVY